MIRKIKAENFKCFEQIELEISNLNLLSGVNSMGKSTLIQILLLLRQSDEQGALERGIYLNGKYTNLGVGKDILYTEAKENRIKFLVENDGCSLETIYDYNNAADFLEQTAEVSVCTKWYWEIGAYLAMVFTISELTGWVLRAAMKNPIMKCGRISRWEITGSMRYIISRPMSWKMWKMSVCCMMEKTTFGC